MNIILPILKIDLESLTSKGFVLLWMIWYLKWKQQQNEHGIATQNISLSKSTGWRPEVSLGIAGDIHNWVRDIVAIGRYLPGKRLVPAERLWDDTSDEEIMDQS